MLHVIELPRNIAGRAAGERWNRAQSTQIKAMANPNLMALTDGSINQDIVHLPKNKYRPPMFPFVDDLTFTPSVYISTRSRK